MAGQNQYTLHDGTVVTVGPCDDPKFPGCLLVSLPSGYRDHTTFIVRERDWSVQAIRSKGKDKEAFRLFLNSIAQSMR